MAEDYTIRIKRVYEGPEPGDGCRVLVDRLWPRGISREKGKIDLWLRDIAPSNELRKWYNHVPERWEEFKSRYFGELKDREESVEKLRTIARNQTMTLLFSTRELERNNATALRDYLRLK